MVKLISAVVAIIGIAALYLAETIRRNSREPTTW